MVPGLQSLPCCHSSTTPTAGPRELYAGRTLPYRHLAERRNASLVVRQSKGQNYHVEVEVDEGEDPEGVYKRFRNSCNLSGMVYEARRRQFFENPQDIKKRKQQEKGQRKARDLRERYLRTYDYMHSDTPPFSELFAGDEDIYDVLGEASYDDGVVEGQAASNSETEQPNRSRANGRSNGGPPVLMRSVPSEGPRQASADKNKVKVNGKPKAQVQTARTRRAARQKASQKK